MSVRYTSIALGSSNTISALYRCYSQYELVCLVNGLVLIATGNIDSNSLTS